MTASGKLSVIISLSLLIITFNSQAQVPNRSTLDIQEFMARDYIGQAPRITQWSSDSKYLYFNWKEAHAESDSSFRISTKNLNPERIDAKDLRIDRPRRGNFNRDKSMELISDQQGLAIVYPKKGDTIWFYTANDQVSGLSFSFDESRVVFTIDRDLFSWDIQNGGFRQLTNFQQDKEKTDSKPPAAKTERNAQDDWLYQDQKKLFPKLKERGNRSGSRFYGYRNQRGGGQSAGGPSQIDLKGFNMYGAKLSPDNRFVTYSLYKPAPQVQGTEMPDYVTISGYTQMRSTRSKVGSLPSKSKLGIFDIERDTAYYLDLSSLPGIFDAPEYYADYPDRKLTYDKPKAVNINGPFWSGDGQYGVMVARSFDNKDRWIFLVDLESGTVKNLDHQHDPAWIGGPGIGYGGSVNWLTDDETLYFQSEETGYSHLYTLNVKTGEKKALTSGDFEVSQPFLSKNKKHWYFHSNEVHPGEKHFYKMALEGGERIQLTSLCGSNAVRLSPDEKHMAITFSFANKPPEIYYQACKPGSEPVQLTDSRSTAFKEYNWRVPEFITFPAEDGASVHARLYQPDDSKKNQAAVIFVHGAGYLQNAHKWWSTYYHEYMFHNLLADNGYTVLDIDYRGSAGYGRDWRTGIYRWMGGKDLSDQVDGAKFLVKECNIDSNKVGLYGGSYGGFITLMALFNEPDVFAAGAALRSVTDWAHYNHGYTANILNTPVLDSLAYAKSSPIYFAEGLQGHLLMCHGMLDSNVHFQDIVRLSQRLIDLGKENWELAVYPFEAHSFSDPDAWTDEYRRIFKLFQSTIGKQ